MKRRTRATPPLVSLGQGDYRRDGSRDGLALALLAFAGAIALTAAFAIDHQVSTRADTQLTATSCARGEAVPPDGAPAQDERHASGDPR